MPDIDKKWNLVNVPPKGHKDVADFAFGLFEISRIEKERLGKQQDFLSNYALYRGKQSIGSTTVTKAHTPVNLYFSNIERTVSNITARQPVGEVVDLDGQKDGAEEIFTVKLKKWWKDSNQQTKTRAAARTMEIYGIIPEKPYWDKDKKEPNIMITDPFAFFPAPGMYDDLGTEPPYVCFAYLDFVDQAEKAFEIKGIAQDDAYELLGVEREKYKADNYGVNPQKIGNYSDPMTRSNRDDKTSSDTKVERCLIIEVWVKDTRTKTVREDLPPEVDEFGVPIDIEITQQLVDKQQVYPDGIRKITITKQKGDQKSKNQSGYMVLDDSANPNINAELELELAMETHPWGRFPVYTANSYRDLISIWGFAAAEQVGDLIVKINQIISKLIAYVINVMAPPLIVQKHCGITKEMIESELSKSGRLILMPTTPNARIEFLQIPNLPSTFFQVLDMIIKMFDRIYQIEDADRGQAPAGVIAASAIVALQERNQVMMQAKTSAIDALIEQRSRWAIGLWQNFGIQPDLVDVAGEPTEFIGTRYAGRKFSYVVEAGSTTPRTSLQVQELSAALFAEGTIDQQARLENINFPDWKAILQRMQAPMFQQLIDYLIEMGLPEELVADVEKFIQENQEQLAGQGSTNQPAESTTKTKPGVPKSKQGPPAGVQ
jgi:hypothetical protein